MQGLDMPCSSPKRHASKNNLNPAKTDHYQARTDTTRLVTGLITQTLTQGLYKTLLNSHARQITTRTQQFSTYTYIYGSVRFKQQLYTKILTCNPNPSRKLP